MARLPLISIWGAKSGDGKTVLAFALCGIAPNNSTSKTVGDGTSASAVSH
jgi:hypothetical protein